ncbi:MAG: nucleotidyltransferase family protein [Candidatus Methanosuratincola sp.]|nr:nucleotidyltransferase family protein [Candidatus Methanosuratincola sp.]
MRKIKELKQKDIINYLDSRKDFFQQKYHVRKIALIGSFARNEQNPQSDVDILIDFDEGTPNIFEVKRLIQQELEEKFNRKVEIASERYIKPYYRKEILSEAVYV